MSLPVDPVLRDFSPSALATAVKGNLYTLFDQFRHVDYAATQSGAAWYAWRTGVSYTWFNGVRVDLPADEVTDDTIEAALGLYTGYNGDISWWLAPGVAVEPWRARLARRGMRYEANTPGMAIDLGTLDTLPAETTAVRGLEIHVMTSAADMRQWSTVFVPGYGLPDDRQEGVYNLICRSGLDLPFRHYLGVLDDSHPPYSRKLAGSALISSRQLATETARGRS